jgi:hypothetical protein
LYFFSLQKSVPDFHSILLSLSMYNMMDSNTGSTSLFPLFWGLHVVSVVIFTIGIALLLMWAFKYLSEQKLRKWGWSLAIIGTILCLLTVSAWSSFGMMGNSSSSFGRTGYGMMERNFVAQSETSSQAKEEADGKALYSKLQAKEAICADLADSDFELIGEYLMGQKAGASHEQMNAMIKQMMGDQGEEQMHISLAKSQTGCAAGGTASEQSSSYGMMNGGGMMQHLNASSSAQ